MKILWIEEYEQQIIKKREGTPITLEQLMNTEGSLFKPFR